MNESVSRRPFRIPADLPDEHRPRWHVRTEDGQLRGPLSDEGLRALTEVGILTDRAQIRGAETEKFVAMRAHPIWPQIRLSKTEFALPLRENILRNGAIPDGPGFWPVRADYPSARNNLREVSTRARERRLWLEAQHLAKMAQIFAALRIAGALRFFREIFIFALFLALGDLGRRAFVETLGSARWLAVFGVVLLALSYYLVAAFQD